MTWTRQGTWERSLTWSGSCRRWLSWLGKGLVVDAHVVACEDADKDAGEETDLCAVTEMAKVEQAQSSSL